MLTEVARFFPLKRLKRALLGTKQPSIALPKRPPSNPNRYLSIVVICKNEARYIAEWLEFHRLVGVEHVYLYDNGSTDDLAGVAAPYAHEGFVTVVPWSLPWRLGNITAQLVAYAHAIENFGRHWRWMAFIDIDEFLFPVEGYSLSELLSHYDDLPAIAAFWTMFGFGGNDSPPDGLVIESYQQRAPFPTHAKPKSIVDPAKVVGIPSAHLFDLTTGPMQAFTESREIFAKVDGLVGSRYRGPQTSNLLRLNHYFSRSRSDFAEKIKKGIVNAQKLRRLSELIESQPVHDDAILRFVPSLKRDLEANRAMELHD